jgi:hypothetical protein
VALPPNSARNTPIITGFQDAGPIQLRTGVANTAFNVSISSALFAIEKIAGHAKAGAIPCFGARVMNRSCRCQLVIQYAHRRSGFGRLALRENMLGQPEGVAEDFITELATKAHDLDALRKSVEDL